MLSLDCLLAMLSARIGGEAREWLTRARSEVAAGVGDERFCALFSLASRYAPRKALAPDAKEIARAADCLAGWNPSRWSTLDAFRVSLILSRRDLDTPAAAAAVEELFHYADVGELCAAYKSLAHIPNPSRFVWRAGEGARSSMKSVFDAACCDTPFAFRWFDEIAWRQALIKALFVEAPLWRVWNVDARLDAEVARMALDLADERRSAGRPINPELWMCLGKHGGARGLEALEREVAGGPALGRAGAAIGLARAGERERLLSFSALEKEPFVQRIMAAALGGSCDSASFAALDPMLHGVR